MISLFKKKETYEVVISKESKSAQPAYSKKLMKVQYKDRLIADHAAAWAAAQTSSAGSTTVTPQSGESTAAADATGAAGAPAPQPSSAPPVLTQDDIKDLYQSHKEEWEEYHK